MSVRQFQKDVFQRRLIKAQVIHLKTQPHQLRVEAGGFIAALDGNVQVAIAVVVHRPAQLRQGARPHRGD